LTSKPTRFGPYGPDCVGFFLAAGGVAKPQDRIEHEMAKPQPTMARQVAQAFTSSAMVQVFRLAQSGPDGSWSGSCPDDNVS
jgi:hypothetical protein